MARRKRLLKWQILGITVKRLAQCRCLDGHVKEPHEMSKMWEPDRRFYFFFSPPAHLCAVTYITEISLIVTLNNHYLPTQLCFAMFSLADQVSIYSLGTMPMLQYKKRLLLRCFHHFKSDNTVIVAPRPQEVPDVSPYCVSCHSLRSCLLQTFLVGLYCLVNLSPRSFEKIMLGRIDFLSSPLFISMSLTIHQHCHS